MPKPKGDMSQRIKNAGFYNKQQAKSTEAGTGKFSAIKAAKANPLEEMKEALAKRKALKKKTAIKK
mgnify:CR=1 FL=1